MTGQQLGDGPGGAGGGPLLPLPQQAALVDGVHQQDERLLRGLDAQQRQEDTSEVEVEKRERLGKRISLENQ